MIKNRKRKTIKRQMTKKKFLKKSKIMKNKARRIVRHLKRRTINRQSK